MDKIKVNIQRFARFITSRLFPPPTPPVHGGAMSDSEYRVYDTVDYTQPTLLPGYLRRAMAADAKLHESVTNAMNVSYRDGFSNPYRSGSDMPIVPTTEDPLMEWDWATRERVLSNCHAAYARNPVANAAVDYTADFVVGDGFNLTCKNPEVEKILEAFISNPENAIRETERQAVIDLQVDGEIIYRFFTEADEVIAVPQRPWELEYIKTASGFFRRPEMYHFQYRKTEGDDPSGKTETEPEDVSAADIQFIAINRHRYELRGRPELYRILPWLRADKDFLEDRVRQNKWRGALLWWVSVLNGNASTIANVAARWRKPPSPGSAYVSSANETVTPLSNPTQADDASLDGRAVRLMILIGMRLPEYFFSDGANANLATTTSQQLPAMTKFEAFQQIMTEQVWTPMFKRVIQAAIDAGKLPEEVEEVDTLGKPVMQDATEDEYEADQKAQKANATEGYILIKNDRSKFHWSDSVVTEAFPPTPMTPPSELPTVPAIADNILKGKAPDPIQEPPQKPKSISALDAFEVSYEPVKVQDLAALTSMLQAATMNGWASNQTAQEKLGFDPTIERDRLAGQEKDDLKKMAQGLKAPNPEVQNMLGMKADMMAKDAKD